MKTEVYSLDKLFIYIRISSSGRGVKAYEKWMKTSKGEVARVMPQRLLKRIA
jgi:hypothetical protein